MSSLVGSSVSATTSEAQRQTKQQARARRTPPTDRGYKITQPPKSPFQAHWFTGTTELSVDEVLEHVHAATGASFLACRFGRQGYRAAYQAVELPGLVVLFEPGEPETMPPVCVVIPGESCEVLGWERLQKLTAPFKPTRVDFAFDDFPFCPAEVKRLVLGGAVRTRAKRRTLKWHEDYAKTDKNRVSVGETVTLGGRGSSQFFRCYNGRGFSRGELELKGPSAEAAYDLLQLPLDQARTVAITFMRRFLDFVAVSSARNMSRRKLLPAWAAWLEGLGKAVVELPPRPADTLERAETWIKSQVLAIAAVLRKAYGPVAFDRFISCGESRWTNKHRLMLGSG